MYFTSLSFNTVIDTFFNESPYDFMILFVSSFDGKDRIIIREIARNAQRIDRITGNRIVFNYFTENGNIMINGKEEVSVNNIPWLPNFIARIDDGRMIGFADDICRYFKILRSSLPAFILINRNSMEKPRVYSTSVYEDFELFLTPLNIIHSYIEDVDTLKSYGYDSESDIYNIQLDAVRLKTIDRLNRSLCSHDGERLIAILKERDDYKSVVTNIWDIIASRPVRINGLLNRIRQQIAERDFKVFISCKSEDYKQAQEIYTFLEQNGYKPFLADLDLKELGVDKYTSVIGEVIDMCSNMVVFATNIDYLETPYVHSEWTAFVNDINTGKKANARLINVLSPDIDVHCLPAWLRDKQSLTTENYKDKLLSFLTI